MAVFNTSGAARFGGGIVVEHQPENVSGSFVLDKFCELVVQPPAEPAAGPGQGGCCPAATRALGTSACNGHVSGTR